MLFWAGVCHIVLPLWDVLIKGPYRCHLPKVAAVDPAEAGIVR